MTTLVSGEGVAFKVWAPKRKTVHAAIEGNLFPLARGAEGYFTGTAPARAGALYRFKLDSDDKLYPDPESCFQPKGPHGPSQVVDHSVFPWTDHAWKGIDPHDRIVYELHIGTFTPDGTFEGARKRLRDLASDGITVIELMPIVEFGGSRGWGYDGVDFFAPSHLYGAPDDVRRFIDEAHGLGMGVILDVVYNHFGPDGNYIGSFADGFFTDMYENDWGESIDFSSEPVREFFLSNAAYWISEFHFDGLRLDATQDIHDESEEHIIAAIAQRARRAAGERTVYIVAENEPQDSRMVRPREAGGFGIDALWNDDWHHSAVVAMTGRREAYYTDYCGSPQEFISAAKYGYLFQGQRYSWQKKRRGAPALDLQASHFVAYLENHDQVANSARGERLRALTDPGTYRAMSALLLLGPWTPMLFQGQEFGSRAPFFYFCDHGAELGKSIRAGRGKFLAQFRSLAQSEMADEFADPSRIDTFERSRIDWNERAANSGIHNLYKDLIRLRREDPVLRFPRRGHCDGAVLAPRAFLLRSFDAQHGDRFLIVNLGADLHLDPAPEPLLAPPVDARWKVLWSSEDPRYGGTGTFPPDSDENWRIAGNSAMLLIPDRKENR